MSPAALALVAAFNLICAVGETTSSSVGGGSATDRDVKIVFRVDLNSKRWCTGECLVVRPIASFTDKHINFAYAEDETVPALLSVQMERDPWILNSTSQTADRIVVRLGLCQQAAFTGFPANSKSGL